VLHLRRSPRSRGDELRAPFVLVNERGSPFTTAGLARMIERAAAGAGLGIKAHPHMLRHACGYAVADKATTPDGLFRDGSDIGRSAPKLSHPIRVLPDAREGRCAPTRLQRPNLEHP
jgi:hypothetical protein